MKANCLTRALDQWEDNPDFILWYNGNHVISLEPEYEGHDLVIMKSYFVADYLELYRFGFEHLAKSFSLSEEYQEKLMNYLDTNPN